MKRSIRRIANTLVVVGVIGISVTYMHSLLFTQCVNGSGGCLAALPFSFSAGVSPREYVQVYTLAQTTSAVPLEGVGWSDFARLVSGYLILVAVLTLIVLEAFELYYIRKMIGLRKSFRLV